MVFQRLDGPSLEQGDEVQVRIEEGRGQVYDATGWHYAIASAIYGGLLLLIGVICLPVDLRGSFDTAGDAATYVVTSMVFGSIGIAAAVAFVKLVTDLRGSRIVDGTVVDSTIEPAAYIGSLNRAKVRYDLDGVSRTVWATPKVRARKAGSSCRVRITGAAPHDVVRTTPIAIAGLVLVTAFGLTGVVLLLLVPLV